MNAQHIASEAAEKAYKAIQDNSDNRLTLDILKEHFQSAIEKAFPELTKAALRLDDMLRSAHASDAWIGERCKFCNEDEGKHKHDCQRPQPAHAREQQIDNDSNYHLYPQ